MLNDIKFKEYMTLMSEIFNKELSNITRDVYWTVLKQFTDDECIKAFKVAIATLKWFPKPSELIDIIKKLELELPVSTEAENQLKFALKWINECSRVPNPVFKDPITHHIMLTRWPQSMMIHSTARDITWFKKEFKEAYIAYEQEQSVLKLENQ